MAVAAAAAQVTTPSWVRGKHGEQSTQSTAVDAR